MGKNIYIIKAVLILTFTAGTGFPLWGSSSFFNNYFHYVSYKDKVITSGFKIDLSMSDICFSANNEGSYNFGLSLFSDNYLKNFPCRFSVGNLSAGGIISSLNNPMISPSSGGFSSCFSELSEIHTTLPSFTSFSRPISLFLDFCYINKDIIFRKLSANCIYTPASKDLSFSTKCDLSFYDIFYIAGTFGICFFNQKEKVQPSWYSDIPYSREERRTSFASQISIGLYNFLCNFSLFCYKTPFGKISSIFKTSNKLAIKGFTFSSSAYINNTNDIISNSNKYLIPCTQIKSNLQYNVDSDNNNFSLKAGVSAYCNISATDDTHDFKLGAACSFRIYITSILLDSCMQFEIKEKNRQIKPCYASCLINNKWDMKYFNVNLGASSRYYISETSDITGSSYRLNLDFNILDDFISNTNCFSFSVNNNTVSNGKFSVGINIKPVYRDMAILIKIGADFQLL